MQKDARSREGAALSLQSAAKARRYRVLSVGGGPQLRARLAALGMEAGAVITVERADGGGIVVACRTTRSTMSWRTAAFLRVEPIPAEDGGC